MAIKPISRKEMEDEVQRKIPIRVSVLQLEEQFEWLRNLTWNGHDENEKDESGE